MPTEDNHATLEPPPSYLQEEVTNECKKLASTLPTEPGWVANHLHLYEGFWHTTRQLQGVVACQNRFQAMDGDIFLVSTPKAGTTWLKAMAYAVVNRARHPDPENHPLLSTNPHELVPFLELHLYIDHKKPDLSSLKSPRLFSTHLPPESLPQSVRDSACKLVYICRNPKDAFVSLWHFTNKLRPPSKGTNSLESTLDKFCRGVSLYGPFWDHVLQYWKISREHPQKVLFMKFEEMKQDPVFHLKKLAEFLGFPFSAEEEKRGLIDQTLKLCSFETLSSLEINRNGKLSSGENYKAFFRRGEVGDYMNHLTQEMIEKLDRITEEKLHGSGLKL